MRLTASVIKVWWQATAVSKYGKELATSSHSQGNDTLLAKLADESWIGICHLAFVATEAIYTSLTDHQPAVQADRQKFNTQEE